MFTKAKDTTKSFYRHSLDSKRSSDSFSSKKLSLDSAFSADGLSDSQRPGSLALACELGLASKKKNDEFHHIFKSVPEYDVLIEDYKCALQKDILLQGHLFVSEHHVCFKSNIFGWVTNLVIHFDEIVRVEKRMTAKVIPNGILIATHTSTHIFASFLSRDQAYDQIMKMWVYNTKSMPQEDTLSDTTVPFEPSPIEAIPNHPFRTRPRSVSDSVTRDHQNAPTIESFFNMKETTVQKEEPEKKKRQGCPCHVDHDAHVALDQTYDGTVESMFKRLFDSRLIKDFLERYEHYEDIELSPWKHGHRQIMGKKRIKSSNTLGAKLVKVLCQQKREYRKYPYYCCVTAKISMPDMPMGAVYSIQSRTCITRSSKNKVHVYVTFQIVFSKSGLVSSIIEKNVAQDQFRLYQQLNAMLQQEIIQPTPSFKLGHFVSIGILVLLLTHCVLVIRMQRISDYLQAVEPHPFQQNLDHAYQRLNQLSHQIEVDE
ncbi:hypothetical protein CU098_007504, partial [Rhizopus stolonifer]